MKASFVARFPSAMVAVERAAVLTSVEFRRAIGDDASPQCAQGGQHRSFSRRRVDNVEAKGGDFGEGGAGPREEIIILA